jgi:trans-aconitate 3-methyltransferase
LSYEDLLFIPHKLTGSDPNTPNASQVQEILLDYENNILGQYAEPGNRISQFMYDTLKLPWMFQPPITAFKQKDFKRREWNRDGKLETGEDDFLVSFKTSIHEMGNDRPTASMYTRWAQANPQLVGTEHDCVRVKARRIREATKLGDFDEIRLGCGVALLLFKKS